MSKKLSFELVMSEIEKRGGSLLSTKYDNIDAYLKIRCNKCNNIWNTSFGNIKYNGSWCPGCFNHKIGKHTFDYVKNKIENHMGTLLSNKYVNSSTKLDILCNVCGTIWHPTFNAIMNGQWCPHCAGCAKPSLNDIESNIKKLGGTLLSKEYKNNVSKLDILCDQCNIVWHSSYVNIKNGSKCPTCSPKKNKKHTFGFVKNIIEEKYGILLSSEYKNANSKISIKCYKCDDIWITRFSTIMQGKKCLNCSGKKKHTLGFIQSDIGRRGGLLLSKEYINNATKIDIVCGKCDNVWSTTFHDVACNYWCPHCKESKGQKTLTMILSEMFVNHEIINQYKKFGWLYNPKTKGTQEIDIYMPKLKLAIEYDGEQHFRPIGYFGGQDKFNRVQKLDSIKNEKIAQHPEDVKYFIRFNYKEKLTKEYITDKLRKHGVPLP